MDINPINGSYSLSRSSGPTERISSAKPQLLPGGGLPDAPVIEVDQIQLTPGSVRLRQMEQNGGEPPIDEAKVATLRAAIASGAYQVNSARLAEKMLDSEQALSA